MLLTYLSMLVVFAAGWGLGRVRPQVDLAMFVFALFGSVMAHSALQWAFLEGRFDGVVGDPRTEVPAAMVILIATVEAVGLWLPFLLIPWAPPKARLALAVYIAAAATVAAIYFYFPFDLGFVSREFLVFDGPPYLFAALGCLPFAALAFVIAFSTASRAMEDEKDELKWPPGAV